MGNQLCLCLSWGFNTAAHCEPCTVWPQISGHVNYHLYILRGTENVRVGNIAVKVQMMGLKTAESISETKQNKKMLLRKEE